MERERLSRAYTSSAASVKFYGALSPENSDNESVNEYNEHHSDVEIISQKKPFSSQGGDRKNSKLSRSRSRSEDEHSPLHHASLDKPHGSRLNASSIERELARALEASDEQAQQGDNNHAGAADTESALSLASYEDEYFHCRPKIVQVCLTYFPECCFALAAFGAMSCTPIIYQLYFAVFLCSIIRSISFGWTT